MREAEKCLESKVKIPLIRHGKKQRIETLINEEALLFARYPKRRKDRLDAKDCDDALNG